MVWHIWYMNDAYELIISKQGKEEFSKHCIFKIIFIFINKMWKILINSKDCSLITIFKIFVIIKKIRYIMD